MLELNPNSVQRATIAKFCSMMGRSQRFANLEWGLVNPERISKFLHRMKIDSIFRTYYHGLYDFIRLLYKRIFEKHSPIVIQSEKQWSYRIDYVLEEEQGALERCEEESIIRRSRIAWLEKMKADELCDGNLWRTKLV